MLPLAADGAEGGSYGSIAAALKENKMTMFTEAAQKTGFISQLQSPGFIGTVFAPTDEAFQAALAQARLDARQRVREAFAEERERAHARVAAARAEWQTRRRLHEQQRAAAWLDVAWQRLPQAPMQTATQRGQLGHQAGIEHQAADRPRRVRQGLATHRLIAQVPGHASLRARIRESLLNAQPAHSGVIQPRHEFTADPVPRIIPRLEELDRHLRPAQRHAKRKPGQAAAHNGDCLVRGGAHARRSAFSR